MTIRATRKGLSAEITALKVGPLAVHRAYRWCGRKLVTDPGWDVSHPQSGHLAASALSTKRRAIIAAKKIGALPLPWATLPLKADGSADVSADVRAEVSRIVAKARRA